MGMSVAEKRLPRWQEPDNLHVLLLLVANGNTLYIDLYNSSRCQQRPLKLHSDAVAFCFAEQG
jgi:hypothetical protein